jgi:hypothetical protein
MKFDVTKYSTFRQLPLQKFNSFNFGVYLLDKDWNYLFVNEFVVKNLGSRGEGLVGKNIWTHFKELASHPAFIKMKEDCERGFPCNFITTSPLTGQRLNVTGQPLSDCYYFSASVLPTKEEIISDLRKQLRTPA